MEINDLRDCRCFLLSPKLRPDTMALAKTSEFSPQLEPSTFATFVLYDFKEQTPERHINESYHTLVGTQEKKCD